ncbi:MAG: putative DNA binding domain-containing protein [Acinetobacter sp.]|nr:putative DNA binding domain-containing protein [Acinetobacter sp.]
MDKYNLLSLLKQGEHSQLECKLALGQNGQGELPKDFWRTYSAMANTYGGLVLLGVREKKQQFFIEGVQDVAKIKKELFDLANNRNHISANVLKDENVYIENVNGKNILVICIPQASRKQKPVFLGKNPIGNTYIRLHEADVHCDEDFIKRMFAEQLNDSRDNEILSEHFNFDEDINHETLNIYRNRLFARKPDHPFLELDLFEFFKKIGAWRKDRQIGKQGITVAGLLMFGHFEAIRDHYPHYFLDYREPSKNRWQERIYLDGSWSGNLFDFYRKVYQRLTENIKIPFQLDNDQRVDETILHEALREALINALVHADYSETTPLLIEKSVDKIQFRNPGSLRITQAEFFAGGMHDCRNALLHQMFLLIGLGERAGSGVPKILKACQMAHWQRPIVEEHIQPPQYMNLMLVFDEMWYSQEQHQVGTKSAPSQHQVSTKSKFSTEQMRLLEKISGEMSLLELMTLISRTDRGKFRTQILNPLIEQGILERTIPDKPTSSRQKYRLVIVDPK